MTFLIGLLIKAGVPEKLTKYVVYAIIALLILVFILIGYWKFTSWQEDRSRARINKVATEILATDATIKQIEKTEGDIKETIENIAIQEGATEAELEKAKEAVKKAKESAKGREITAEDLMELINE